MIPTGRQHCLCFALTFVVALVTSCGAKGDRISLSGSVKQDGKPLEVGKIDFQPTPGTKAPAAGTAINSGWYRFDSETGPIPGQYKVRITTGKPPRKFSTDKSEKPQAFHEFSCDVTRDSRDLAFELPP